MIEVYFVRHSLRDLSVHHDNAPLSPEGKKRAEQLISLFENIHLDHIFSSPFLRTMDTVQPIAISKNLNIIEIPDFHERIAGKWLDDFDSYAQHQWMDFDFKLAGGESLHEVQKRNLSALRLRLATLVA